MLLETGSFLLTSNWVGSLGWLNNKIQDAPVSTFSISELNTLFTVPPRKKEMEKERKKTIIERTLNLHLHVYKVSIQHFN